MKLVEIRQLEETREDQMNVVHLIKEGAFYHAYDWSAWLMSKFPIGEAKNRPMAVTASKLNDDYINAFVGFPATSIGKYVPNSEIVEFRPVEDTRIDIVMNVDLGDATVEDIRLQPFIATDEEKDCSLRLQQAVGSGEEHQQLPRHIAALIVIQSEPPFVYE